nr:hypothetical protein B0A51_09112 [Rachicladosporium sp. CCFEE 5018]
MATVDVLAVRTLGLLPTDSHWPAIIAALRTAGFTATVANAFHANFARNWELTRSTAYRIIFLGSHDYAAWVHSHHRNPTDNELGPLLAAKMAAWKNANKCTTTIIRTSSDHGHEIGARVSVDASLIVAGHTSAAQVFYRPFTVAESNGVVDDDPSGEPPADPILPFNCQGLFGGVDATQSFSKGEVIRSNLFELRSLEPKDYLHQEVQWEEQGTVNNNEDHVATFAIPRYLDFVWETRVHEETVTGETKREFQSNLSSNMGLAGSIDGFGLEMNHSFNETDFSETWNKYASLYRYHQVYTLKLNQTDPAKLHLHLTDHALETFDVGTPASIVDTFGTHFMTKATFGGLKRWSSTLDVRNTDVSKSLGRSLGIKVAETSPAPADSADSNGQGGGKAPDSGSIKISDQDSLTQKIYNSMEKTTTDVLGGTPGSSSDDWTTSLYRNPAVINFTLRNIADLVLNPDKAAAVQAEVDARMKAVIVKVSHKAQIMFNSFSSTEDDHGSGGQMDISCAGLNRIDGWFNIGHYTMGSLGWDTSGYQGLMIRDIPDAKVPLIVKGQGTNRNWGMRSPHRLGLFELLGPAGYVSLSDMFIREEWIGVDRFEDHGMVHQDELTVEGEWGSKIWDDSHTGSNDVGSAWRVEVGAFDDAKSKIMIVPDGKGAASLFKCFNTQNTSTGKPRKLDLSKCKMLKNHFL